MTEWGIFSAWFPWLCPLSLISVVIRGHQPQQEQKVVILNFSSERALIVQSGHSNSDLQQVLSLHSFYPALPWSQRLGFLEKSGKYLIIKMSGGLIEQLVRVRLELNSFIPRIRKILDNLIWYNSDIYSSRSFRELDRAFCLFLNVYCIV